MLKQIDLRISLALPAFLPSAFFNCFCQNRRAPLPPLNPALKSNLLLFIFVGVNKG